MGPISKVRQNWATCTLEYVEQLFYYRDMKTHCTATNKDRTPCRAWAVRGSDPPRCSAHGGGRAPVGAPSGNHNARTHGFYVDEVAPLPEQDDIPDSIAEVIHDLAVKQARLSKIINGKPNSSDIHVLARLLQLHAQTASRLGRLLRDQRALSGEAADGISAAIAQALDELSTELDTDF